MAGETSPNTAVNSPVIHPFDSRYVKAPGMSSNGCSDLDPSRQTTMGLDSNLSKKSFGKDHPLYDDLAPEDSYANGVYWVGLT